MDHRRKNRRGESSSATVFCVNSSSIIDLRHTIGMRRKTTSFFSLCRRFMKVCPWRCKRKFLAFDSVPAFLGNMESSAENETMINALNRDFKDENFVGMSK